VITSIIAVVLISFIFTLDDIATAQVSQTISAITLFVCFPLCWKYFPTMMGKHKLSPSIPNNKKMMMNSKSSSKKAEPTPTGQDDEVVGSSNGEGGIGGTDDYNHGRVVVVEEDVRNDSSMSGITPTDVNNNNNDNHPQFGWTYIGRLFRAGLIQNYKTFTVIAKDHPPLKWFLFTVIWGEAGNSGLIPVMITIMTHLANFQSTEVGIMFFISLTSAIPGLVIGTYVCKRYNPSISIKCNLTLLSIVTLTFGLCIRQDRVYLNYGAAVLWGALLGWYYSTQQLYFSSSLPPEQETELSGFYVYCTILLTWFPPLIGTVMLEANIQAQYLTFPVVGCQLMGLFCACMCPSWEIIVESARKPLVIDPNNNNSSSSMDRNDDDDDDRMVVVSTASPARHDTAVDSELEMDSFEGGTSVGMGRSNSNL
jgi:hypothetical protein